MQAVCWSLYLLAKHPEWQTRLREEVWAACGRPGDGNHHPPASYKDISAMPLVQCVIYEALRLYPPLWNILRQARQDVTIDISASPLAGTSGDAARTADTGTHLTAAGQKRADTSTSAQRSLTIKAGTVIDIFISGTHRNELYWKDPDTFDPLRFKDGIAGATRHPCAFLPFSHGSRNCIGFQFALLEARTILAVLLQSVEWELGPGYRHQAAPGLTLFPRNGMPLRLRSVARPPTKAA